MPYHVGKSASCPESKPHAVIKDADGKVMGCHSSQADAHQQIAAIHANEGASVGDELDEDFHLKGKHNQSDHAGGGATRASKGEADKARKRLEKKYPGRKFSAEEIDLEALNFVEFAVAAPGAITGGYAEDDLAAMSGTPWEGILLVEGIETGDGREFSPNAVTWVDPQQVVMPLRRNVEESHGGAPSTKTVLVGRIDEVWRDPDNPMMVRGRGVFDDNGAEGREALRLVRERFLRGISVDPDDIKEADVELIYKDEDHGDDGDIMGFFTQPEKTMFHAGRLRAATLVDIPAFVEAQIWLADASAEPTAQVSAVSQHYAAFSDRTWNGPAHEQRLRQHATLAALRQSFAHVAVNADSSSGARFLHHEIGDDGRIGPANISAVAASMRVINAGRAALMSVQDRRAAYDHLAAHMRAAGLTPPPYEGEDTLIAAGPYPEQPPREWFEDPQLLALTPLTITDDGRVFGHGAAWGTCHTSFPGACVTPPTEGEHAYYRLGEVLCADGSRVAVGSITLGTGHAPIRNISASQAAEHYDNTGTVVALVASGEDVHGIWVAGSIRHGTPPGRVDELRAAALSGDWRRIGGSMRLVAFLAVNRPGFPIPRLATHVSRDRQLSLVASGVVTQAMRSNRDDGARAAFARIARGIGRDPQSRMAELKVRVSGGR